MHRTIAIRLVELDDHIDDVADLRLRCASDIAVQAQIKGARAQDTLI